MALLLIRCTDGHKPESPQDGDVIEIRAHDAPLGRCESKAVWEADQKRIGEFEDEIAAIGNQIAAAEDAVAAAKGTLVRVLVAQVERLEQRRAMLTDLVKRLAGPFPETVVLVSFPDLPDEDAAALMAPNDDGIRRRKMTLDYEALERRTPESGRDTLRTERQITRAWAEVSNLAAVKA